MDHFILFLCDGVCGYYFQAIGYLLMICAANRYKPNKKVFFGMSVLYGLLTFGIRSITIISPGFHTMLIITSFIFLSIFILKTKIFPTVIGVLSSTIITLFFEIIILGASSLIFDSPIFQNDDNNNIQGDIKKALYGIPVNILLVLLSFIIYKKRLKNKEKNDDGSAGE